MHIFKAGSHYGRWPYTYLRPGSLWGDGNVYSTHETMTFWPIVAHNNRVAAMERPVIWRMQSEAESLQCTPEAECQWWADRLGDKWGSVERLRESTRGFFHLRAQSSGGFFIQGGARHGLIRRRAAQPSRGYLLLVRGGAGPGRRTRNCTRQAARVWC